MKKKMLLIVALVLVVTLAVTTGCSGGSSKGGGGGGGDTITIRVGCGAGPGNPQVTWMENFKEYCAQESNGRIVVEVYPVSQLGTLAQMVQSVSDGSVEMYLMPTSYWAAVVPEVEAVELPGLFDDTAHAVRALSSGNTFDEVLESAGLKVLAWCFLNDHYIASNKEIKTVADLQNMKIWCNPGVILEGWLKAVGATPSLLDTGEITSGLQNNTIDGCLGGLGLFLPFNIQSVSDYLYMAPRIPTVSPVMANLNFINNLPADMKKIILEGATIVAYEGFGEFESVYDYGIKYQDNAIIKVEEDGMKVIYPTASDWDDIHAKMASVAEQVLRDHSVIVPYYEELLGLADATR